ncbi:MAG: hypothetical protein ACOCWR_02555 [Oceanidesulfovibrio sp.]
MRKIGKRFYVSETTELNLTFNVPTDVFEEFLEKCLEQKVEVGDVFLRQIQAAMITAIIEEDFFEGYKNVKELTKETEH